MSFEEILAQVLELLQREGRVAYRALKRRFTLDDEYLEDLKAEIIDAKRVAVDEDGKVLVWTSAAPVSSSTFQVPSSYPPDPSTQHPDARPQTLDPRPTDGERRQLTVMFCDLVGSTALSEQLDPEELREVVRAYQQTSSAVIDHYDGHIAQHLGDGLLVYFGYPVAHEDDAQRAVRAGLGIIEALRRLSHAGHKVPSPLAGEGQSEGVKVTTSALSSPHPNLPPQGGKEQSLQVRIGIHTGLVVVGEVGSSDKREVLALGETPNIAARLQGLAEPDTVVISAATQRLVAGLFDCQGLGPQTLKGISAPLSVYRVKRESEAQSRFEVAVTTGLTPIIGREHEVGLLQERWTRATQGAGQVVLLSGEAGIGKSRLVQTLKEHVIAEGTIRIEFRCSPYYQHSAFHPLIEHLQRLLQFAPQEAPQAKLDKLAQRLTPYHFPQADTLPLLAALLSLPHPEGAPPLTLSPQKQKQKMQEALVAWIVEEADKAPVYCAWEDLHWADPSTLEFLTLFLDQVPTTRLLVLLTFRPDFAPPWGPRSYLSQLTLSRLGRPQVEAMVEKVTGGKALPSEVLQQIVAKTDGVPLFVEELTKMVLESGLVTAADDHYELTGPLPPLAIPSTLQDSLMARLDRLATTREIAQLGATLGREFSYELIHAISPLDEATLQQRLRQLVEAELVYQRGQLPQATYLFKHALVQETAYQSLLKSMRQHYHQQIAQVLDERFAEIKETHPELLAHHYTEAGLIAQAIPYWQKAGERATQRSANVEAIRHLTKGLDLLKTLPDTSERTQQELMLQIALGVPLVAAKSYTAPEVKHTYTRALELCRQMGETPQLFPVLRGLQIFYTLRAELQTGRELAKQLLTLAQRVQDPALLLGSHSALGQTLFFLGELTSAREHLEQGLALYDPQQYRSLTWAGALPAVQCLYFGANALWLLGYPDQALKRSQEALTLTRELSHPLSLVLVLHWDAILCLLRREEAHRVQERAEAAITLSTEHGFALYVALGTIVRGWALAEQGQKEEGIVQIRQCLAALLAIGVEVGRPALLAILAEVHGKAGRTDEGLSVLDEALALVDKTGERWWEAEMYRLRGQLTLQKFQVSGSRFQVLPNPQPLTPSPQAEAEAEACFHKAIEVARQQSAKSWELRAVMSLNRLWQQQGKKEEARQMLAEIYSWFTEGFETKDLQEAKVLLEELSY